jgi:hypothetical protein
MGSRSRRLISKRERGRGRENANSKWGEAAVAGWQGGSGAGAEEAAVSDLAGFGFGFAVVS